MNPEKTNSCVGTPTMGQSSDYAKPGMLDAKSPVVGGSAHIGGDYVPVPMKSASVTGPTGLVETTASNENLSAKFKYPHVTDDQPSQDMVAKSGSNI